MKIPADILTRAAAAVEAMPQRPPFKADMLAAIAGAILTERKRCADIVAASEPFAGPIVHDQIRSILEGES